MKPDAPPKPRHWRVTIVARCRDCRRETQQVTNRTLYPNGQQQSETICYTCGAVVSRSSVRLGSRR